MIDGCIITSIVLQPIVNFHDICAVTLQIHSNVSVFSPVLIQHLTSVITSLSVTREVRPRGGGYSAIYHPMVVLECDADLIWEV